MMRLGSGQAGELVILKIAFDVTKPYQLQYICLNCNRYCDSQYCIRLKTSIVEPQHVDAAPTPGKNFDKVLAPAVWSRITLRFH
jgi:hypothetical protein